MAATIEQIRLALSRAQAAGATEDARVLAEALNKAETAEFMAAARSTQEKQARDKEEGVAPWVQGEPFEPRADPRQAAWDAQEKARMESEVGTTDLLSQGFRTGLAGAGYALVGGGYGALAEAVRNPSAPGIPDYIAKPIADAMPQYVQDAREGLVDYFQGKSGEASREAVAASMEEANKLQQMKEKYGEGFTTDLIVGGAQNLSNVLPLAGGLVVGALTRSPAAGIATQRTLATIPAAQAYANAYTQYKSQYPDASEEDAQNYAKTQAGLEYLFEAVGPVKAGATIAETLLKRTSWKGLSEAGTSGIQQIAQQIQAPELAPQTAGEAAYDIGLSGTLGTIMGAPVSAIGASQATADFNAAKNPPPVVAPTPTGDSAIDAGQAAAAAISQQASATSATPDIESKGASNLPMTWAPGVDLDTPRGEVSTIGNQPQTQEPTAEDVQPTRNLPVTWASGVDLETPQGAVSDIRTQATTGDTPIDSPEVRSTAEQITALSDTLVSTETQRKAIQEKLTETMTRKERKALNEQATALIAKENEIKLNLSNLQQVAPETKTPFSESPPILDVQPTQQPTIADQLVAAKEQGQAQPQTGLVLPMTRAERVAQAKSTVTAPPIVPATKTTTTQTTPVVAPQPTGDTFVNEETGEVERLIPANDPERLAVENAIEQAVAQGNTRAARNNVAMAVGDLVRDGQDARTPMRTILLNSIRRNRSAGGAIGALKVMAAAQKKTSHKLYDAPEGIDKVIASLENHPMLKNMKLEVVDSIDNLPDDIKNEYTKRNNRVSGLYSADNDTLYLSGDVTEGALGGRFSTVVHELVHATTLRALNLHKAGKLKDRGLVKATQNFQEVYDQFLKRTVDFKDYNIPSYERGAIAYARSDINEFLTMSLTSPEFRSATKSVGLWRQIKDAVRRILRLPQTDQELFDTIIERGLDLIEATRKGEAALQQEWVAATGKGVNNTPDQAVRDTIEVDGVERPRTNSNGQPIELDDEKLRNFWRWFGDSKVVDKEGRPLVVYHGTKGNFSVFDSTKSSTPGMWFTENRDVIEGLSDNGVIMPVYLSVKSPARLSVLAQARRKSADIDDTQQRNAEVIKNLQQMGVDGINDPKFAGYGGNGSEVWAVIRPEQIKSAIGNKGTYDPQNPSIVADVTIAQEAKAAKSALQSSVASATRGIASVALPNQGVDTGASDFSARLAGERLVNDRKMIGLINKGSSELESVPLSERPALNDKMTKALRGEKQTLPDEAAKTVKMVREHLDDLSTQLLIELKAAYAGKPIPESELAKMKAIAKERGKYLSRVYDIDFGKMKGNHLLDAYAAGKPTAVARVKPALDHLTSKVGSLPQRIAEAKAEADRRNQEEPLSGNQKWTTKDVWEMVGDKSTIKSYYTDIIGSPAGKSQDTMLSELEEAAKGINPDTAKDIAMQTVADLVGASEQSKSKSGSRGEYYQGLRARDAAMKSRSDMPPWLRNLWGEVNDFISVSAITAARITDVTASVRLGNQLMEESPHLFSDSRPTDKDWVQVGGSSPSAMGLYGKVAGKWTPPEVAALLNGAFNPNGAFELSLENLTKNPLGWAGTAVSKTASKVTGALKSSLIKWNPASWVFNLGNFGIIPLNNGNFNPAYLKEASDGMGYLLGTAYKKAKDLTDKQKPVAALLDEALRQGVVDPVMVRTDDEVRLAERERQAMVDAGPVEGITQRISRGRSNFSNTVTEGVNFLETTPKLANFYYWLDVMAKTEKYKGLGLDHKKIGQMLADGATTRQVRLLIREAAVRTSENNISYNKVPKIVKAVEKGLLGSFVNFYFESMRAPIRSALNGVKDLKSGDPALKAAGFRSLVGGTMGMLTTPALHIAAIKSLGELSTVVVGGLLSGVGNEEDEERRKDLEAVLRTSLAYSEGNSRALVDVDENGNVWVTDTGRADTYDTWHSLVKSNLDAAYMFANGEEDAAIEKAKDTFTGVFSNFLGGSLVGGLASDVVADRNRKLFFEDAFPETADRLEEYFGKGANNLINLITPGVAKGLIKGAGTPEDAPTAIKVLNFFNAPLNKIDTLRGVGAVAGRLSGDRRDAMKDLVESVASVDEIKEDRLAAAVDTYRGAYLETWKELRDQVEAAQAAFRLGGVPPRTYNPRIRQAILDVYSNNQVADSVMSGKFFIPPLSDEAFVRGVEDKKALIKDRANAEELLLRLKAREKFVRDYYKEIKVEQPN